MSEVPKGFHACNGWYFRRENDGAVHITAPDSMGPGAHQVVTLDAETWTSVVASVSPDGDTVATYIAAHHIHDGKEPSLSPEDIANRFEFHPASTPERKAGHEFVRTVCGSLADSLNEVLPEGREKALAMTNLEQVMFWANAAIARQEGS